MAGKSIISMSSIFEFFTDVKIVRRGENSVSSGFVQKAMYDGNLNLIRGEVHASMKQKLYNVEIILSSDGDIQKASCNCPKGLDFCHHMASLAIFAHKNFSVTDTSCQWSKVKTSDDDAIITAEKCFPSSTTFSPLLEDISEESLKKFKDDVKACGPTGLGWLLSPEPTQTEEIVIADVEELIFSEEYANHEDRINFLKENLQLTIDRISKIEKMTVGQTNNPLWHIVRRHRLTASNFGRVLKACKRGRFPPSLFETLTGNTNLDGIKQIQWGRSNESVAIKKFEAYHNAKIIKSGLWLDDCGFLGASPDGLVDNNTLIEVKCPFKFRDSIFQECLLGVKDYIVSFNGETFVLNVEHDYYDQIQGQLYICGREKCILVLWSCKDYVEIQIAKDVQWQKNVVILKDFYLNKYIQHILN